MYEIIRGIGGFDNWSMVLIEKFACSDSNEAHKRERFWVEALQATLNTQIPSRTLPQRREDNKESIKIWANSNYLKHRERMVEKSSCGCGGRFTTKNKTTHCKTAMHLEYFDKF